MRCTAAHVPHRRIGTQTTCMPLPDLTRAAPGPVRMSLDAGLLARSAVQVLICKCAAALWRRTRIAAGHITAAPVACTLSQTQRPVLLLPVGMPACMHAESARPRQLPKPPGRAAHRAWLRLSSSARPWLSSVPPAASGRTAPGSAFCGQRHARPASIKVGACPNSKARC